MGIFQFHWQNVQECHCVYVLSFKDIEFGQPSADCRIDNGTFFEKIYLFTKPGL